MEIVVAMCMSRAAPGDLPWGRPAVPYRWISTTASETGLQRTLPRDVFGRAYGLAIPVSIGGIGAGSLIASALASTVGLTGALLVCGSIAIVYGAALVRGLSMNQPHRRNLGGDVAPFGI